jgi:hypothetical protein
MKAKRVLLSSQITSNISFKAQFISFVTQERNEGLLSPAMWVRSLVDVYRRFGGMDCFHFQGQKYNGVGNNKQQTPNRIYSKTLVSSPYYNLVRCKFLHLSEQKEAYV